MTHTLELQAKVTTLEDEIKHLNILLGEVELREHKLSLCLNEKDKKIECLTTRKTQLKEQLNENWHKTVAEKKDWFYRRFIECDECNSLEQMDVDSPRHHSQLYRFVKQYFSEAIYECPDCQNTTQSTTELVKENE
jgi:hypothetical protein